MAFAVNLLATFNQEPKEVHMKAPNRVLDRTVWFDILQNQFLQFTQVLTGALWLPKHGDDNVWWIWSAKQKSVSLSTAEAEYMDIVEGARTGMWFRQEAQRLTFNMYILYSEVSVAKLFQCQMTKLSSFSLTIRQLYKCIHPAYHPQTKHIARRFHYTREEVERSTITVQYIHSYWQPTGRHPHSEELLEFVWQWITHRKLYVQDPCKYCVRVLVLNKMKFYLTKHINDLDITCQKVLP